jgi:predicted TIM-barrel fold metal-dependent hydrolase
MTGDSDLTELQKRICYPPDPNPRRPNVPPPSGACDTHFHLFGPPHLYPFQPRRVYTPPAAPLQHYLNMAEIVGLERGVIVTPNAHGTDNTVSLDAIAATGGRFRGIAKIDDQTTDAELRRLHEGGFRGARFNCIAELGGRVDVGLFERSIARIAELGWCVEFHVKPDGLVELADWLRGIPVPVIIDHFARVDFVDGVGQKPFQLLVELMRNENFWSKISGGDRQSAAGPPYGDTVPFAEALIAVAEDRLIWGTDWPHSSIFRPGQTPNDGDLIDLMALMAPDETIRRKIYTDNPARLFGFDRERAGLPSGI